MEDTILKDYGRYRTVMAHDYDGFMPDGDVYVPQKVIRAGYGSMGTGLNWGDADVTEGELEYAYERLGDWGLVARWARVFYGVDAKIFRTSGYSQSDWADILVWPSEVWCDKVGVPKGWGPSRDDVSDLSAWLWGDTYVVTLERAVTWTSEDGETRDEWEPVETVDGFYGPSWELEKDEYLIDYFDAEVED